VKTITKIVFILFLLFIFILSGSCSNTAVDNLSNEIESSCEVSSESEEIPPIYTEQGIPLENKFSASSNARTVWDMIMFDGYLYVGCGDYDKNAGPCDVMRYNLTTKKWENSGTVQDEQINRFQLVNGDLIIPGMDAKEGVYDWSYGNYYQLENNEWKTVRSIPNAQHVFDIIKHNGLIFAGIGVGRGSYPVAVSSDEGISFIQVPLYKNGIAVNIDDKDDYRVYDLFYLNKHVYALFEKDVYRYEEGIFIYEFSWGNKIVNANEFNLSMQKVFFKDMWFFSTGYVFCADEVNNFKYLPLAEGVNIVDMYVDNDILYALHSKKIDVGYEVAVYKNESGNAEDFIKVTDFDYEIPAISLAVENNTFYFGMGIPYVFSAKNGIILEVTIK